MLTVPAFLTMSQSDDAQDPDDPHNPEEPLNTSSTSSGSSSTTSSKSSCSASNSSTTTFTSVSSSTSKATITGGSDLEDASDYPEHPQLLNQQQFEGSQGHSINLGDFNCSTVPPHRQNYNAELEKGPVTRTCDKSIGTNLTSTPSCSSSQAYGSGNTSDRVSTGGAQTQQDDSSKKIYKFSDASTPGTSQQHSVKLRMNLPGSSTTKSTSLSYSTLCPETDLDLNMKAGPITNQLKSLVRPIPSPSPSLSVLDTNNNNKSANLAREDLANIRKTNFSKSASGSKLISRSRPNVCDCLSQSCKEKEHSTRRQFIEHYYRSRTQLPSTNAMSSINISTPLNRLSECDAITKRLLSSPRRGPSINESSYRRVQAADSDMSRRASLGADTITEQLYLFSSSPFKSSYRARSSQKQAENPCTTTCDADQTIRLTTDDSKPNKQQQQQGRSLSVCDDETRKPKAQSVRLNHSPNLNRAVSLACDTGHSRRLTNIIPLFGCEVNTLEQFTKMGLVLPPVINSAIDHIVENGIDSVGIFRKSGVKSRILTLKQLIETNQAIRFDEVNKENEYSIHDIADLVKMWFRELKPTPLMTKELIKLITDILSQQTPKLMHSDAQHRTKGSVQKTSHQQSRQNENEALTAPKNRLKSGIDTTTTPVQRAIFLRALSFLATISAKSEINQMTSQNLAICLTPSLCATDPDQSSILAAQKALEYCIDNYQILF